ncbi:MAG: branched-chain amino acid ABC transporter permease [Actinomycetes bacterium]|jgi:branched-chain amino acid transport system permease protein
MKKRSRTAAIYTFITLTLLVSTIALSWIWAGPTLQPVIAQGFAFLIATIALYLFVGNSGIFSFGHIAFMSLGAYVAAILMISPANKKLNQPGLPHFLATAHLNPVVATLIGGIAASLIAFIVSLPLIKLSGLTASLTSLAILEIVHVVAANWTNLTNGELGLTGIPLLPSITELWFAAVMVIAAAMGFQQSRWGRRLRASREDEVAARSLGLTVNKDRRIAFVISAFFMGIAGALYVQLLGALVPETLYISATTMILIMLIVGGMTSLSGAVVGSIAISTVSEILVKIQDGVQINGLDIKGPIGIQPVGLAIIMLLTLIIFPKGITRSREIAFRTKV